MKLCYISIVYILTVIWASKHLKDFGHSMILPLRKSQPLSPRPCFAHSRHSQSPLLWFTPRTFWVHSHHYAFSYITKGNEDRSLILRRSEWHELFHLQRDLLHHKDKLLLPQPSPFLSWLNVNPDTVPWKPAGNVKALMLSSPCGRVSGIQCLGPTGAFWNHKQQLKSWVFRKLQLKSKRDYLLEIFP